jgi:ankyrin repeat protein
VAKLLLDEGANIEAGDSSAATALHYAAERGYKDVVELLISHGADVSARRTYPAGDTPLHGAARAEHENIVRLLVDNGADVNAKNNEGLTPADVAVRNTRKMVTPLTPVAKLLIAKGADISVVSAVHVEDLDKVRELIQEGASINVKDQRGRTALHYAAAQGHKEIVELLLANGADVNASTNFYMKTPAEFAMGAGHNEVAKLLISKGADISPLNFALHMGDLAKAKSLIEGGADVNKPTPYGTTPLQRAVDKGCKDIVELLIAYGADVNARDNWNWMPLHSAVYKTKDMVELLIANGANVNAKDGGGRTALWYAQKEGYTEIIELLRKHGAKE